MTQPALASPERIALDAALAEIDALNALTLHLENCERCSTKTVDCMWWDNGDCPRFTSLLDKQSETCHRLKQAEAALKEPA